jgi:hypothetical protein
LRLAGAGIAKVLVSRPVRVRACVRAVKQVLWWLVVGVGGFVAACDVRVVGAVKVVCLSVALGSWGDLGRLRAQCSYLRTEVRIHYTAQMSLFLVNIYTVLFGGYKHQKSQSRNAKLRSLLLACELQFHTIVVTVALV